MALSSMLILASSARSSPSSGERERIDLDERRVVGDEGVVEPDHQALGVVRVLLSEADVRGEAPCVGGVQSVERVDGDLGYPLRMLPHHRLDRRPPGVGADEGDPRRGAIEPEGEVVLARRPAHRFDVHPADVLAVAAGLGGDEPRAEHLACDLPDVGRGRHHLHAAGEAAVAGPDLGLDDPVRAADPARGGLGLVGRERALAGWRCQSVRTQKLLGLILVDVHQVASLGAARYTIYQTPDLNNERAARSGTFHAARTVGRISAA